MKIGLIAGNYSQYNVNGKQIRLISADAVVKVTVTKSDGETEEHELYQGIAWTPESEFISVGFQSETNQNIEFTVTKGDIQDNRISGTINVKTQPMQGIKTTIQQVIAASGEFIAVQANASRYGLTVKNTGAGNILIGSVDVVSNGYRLKPDAEFKFKSAFGSEVYVVAETATDSEVSVFEEYETLNYSIDTSTALTTESGAVLYDESGNILTVE